MSEGSRLHGRTLLRDTALMYTSSISGGAVQYAALILMARTLGPRDLGVVVLVTTVASMIAAGTELGIGPVLVRYRPELADSKPHLWAALVHAMARIVGMVVCALTAVAIAAAILGILDPSIRSLTRVGAYGAGIGVPIAIMAFLVGYLQAERRFGAIAVLGVAVAAVRLGLVATCVVLHSLTVDSALACYLAAALLGVAAGWLMTLGRARFARFDADHLKVARGFALPYLRWSMLGRASAALVVNLDVILVSLIAGARATGVYGAAYQSATPVVMLATAVGEVSFPHLVASSRSRTSREVLRRWATWLPPVVCVGALAAFLGGHIVPLLLGPEFTRSVAPFEVLVFAYALEVWLQPVGSLLYARNRQRAEALITLAQTLTLLVAGVALIPALGALGPAVAVLAGTLVKAPLQIVAALRKPDAGPGSPPTLTPRRSAKPQPPVADGSNHW